MLCISEVGHIGGNLPALDAVVLVFQEFWPKRIVSSCQIARSNLTVMVDQNGLQGFGATAEVASMSGLREKLAGFDIDLAVVAGHDLTALRTALLTPHDRPRVLLMQTVKGKGVSFMEHQMEWHYRPLTDALYAQAIQDIETA